MNVTVVGGHKIGTCLSGEFWKGARNMNSNFLLMKTARNYLMECHVVFCSNSAEKNSLTSGCTSEVLSFLSKERHHFPVSHLSTTMWQTWTLLVCMFFYSPYIYFYENFNGRKKSHCFPSNLLCTFTSLYSFILYSTLSLCWHSDFLHHVFLLWKSFPNYNLLESKFLWDFFQSI